MSILTDLRTRLDDLERLRNNPESNRDAVKWMEQVLSFKALDALPILVEMTELLASEADADTEVISMDKTIRVWEIVNRLTKEVESHDTAANCG